MRFVACFASMSTLASNFFAKARVHGDDMDKERRRNAKTWDVIFMRLLIWIWIAMIDLILSDLILSDLTDSLACYLYVVSLRCY